MLRVVLDTNIIVSGIISSSGNPRRILQAWRQKEFTLLSSEAVIQEVTKVFHYPHLSETYQISESDVQIVVQSLVNDAELLEDLYEVERSRDPDDNVLLACALEGKADYLVSGDSDLLSIKYYHGTQIRTPKQFLEILERLN